MESKIPNLVLLGLNHTTAPVELRERLVFSDDDISNALSVLTRKLEMGESAVLSTCNRVELIAVAVESVDVSASLRAFLTDFKRVAFSEVKDAVYEYTGEEAVRHLFRVASGLDSMIVGEPQILGQVKGAFRLAVQHKTTGVILNRLFHRTFSVAKRVRTETGIGDHAVSVSYAAIELARKIFGRLEDKKVMLIGAGEMAELAVEHLSRNRVA